MDPSARNRWQRSPRRRDGAAAALAIALLAGCAAAPQRPVPEEIRQPPAGDLQLVEARQAPETHLGTRVRWGGSVVAVDHDAGGNATVEVIERRLDAGGRPRPGSASDGRFVIRAAADVDSSLYRRGNEITVSGTLDGVTEGRVGDETVRLPVVRVDAFVQWPPQWREDPYYRHYYPYGPWGYDPRYPYPRMRFGFGVGHIHHRHHGYGAFGRFGHGPFWH